MAQIDAGKFLYKVESLLCLVCLLLFKNISEGSDCLASQPAHCQKEQIERCGDSLETVTLMRVRNRKRNRQSRELPKLGQQVPFKVMEECLSHSKLEANLVE